MIDENMPLGKQLRLMRAMVDVGQREIANYLKISITRYSDIERGRGKPTHEFIEGCVRYFSSKGIAVNRYAINVATGIARGRISLTDMGRQHAWMVATLASTELTTMQIARLNDYLNELRSEK